MTIYNLTANLNIANDLDTIVDDTIFFDTEWQNMADAFNISLQQTNNTPIIISSTLAIIQVNDNTQIRLNGTNFTNNSDNGSFSLGAIISADYYDSITNIIINSHAFSSEIRIDRLIEPTDNIIIGDEPYANTNNINNTGNIYGVTGTETVYNNTISNELTFALNHERNTANNFEDDLNSLQINNNLWIETNLLTQISNEYSMQVNANFMLDFGNTDISTSNNITQLQIQNNFDII